MKRLIGAVTIAMSIAISTSPAQAKWMDGNELLAICDSSDSADKIQCMGYIQGVLDASDSSLGSKEIPPVDTPDNVTAGQLKDIVIAYLKANPEKRHTQASDLVFTALVRAFGQK
ncbi:Rap1a/Tai family immunity protein [Sphingomonas sp. LaA6.9]|uniref:Rap1a/Tai family immunity protein n=1 Tax=Sphingomonas sp. LaA6.9 TaxID=2919914 RepID=UPI001F4F5591|nr:Rap1a/Tai family immunity protein [Sphingomonas sp. LaA6.9]MCJ8157238.1 hypothetical protein [Sphingomonas sp. LaA6.9]